MRWEPSSELLPQTSSTSPSLNVCLFLLNAIITTSVKHTNIGNKSFFDVFNLVSTPWCKFSREKSTSVRVNSFTLCHCRFNFSLSWICFLNCIRSNWSTWMSWRRRNNHIVLMPCADWQAEDLSVKIGKKNVSGAKGLRVCVLQCVPLTYQWPGNYVIKSKSRVLSGSVLLSITSLRVLSQLYHHHWPSLARTWSDTDQTLSWSACGDHENVSAHGQVPSFMLISDIRADSALDTTTESTSTCEVCLTFTHFQWITDSPIRFQFAVTVSQETILIMPTTCFAF